MRKLLVGLVVVLVVVVIANRGSAPVTRPARAPGAASSTARPPSSGPGMVKDSTIVWRSSEALTRGIGLIDAGVHRSNPDALAPLIACLAEPGDSVAVVGMATGTREVMLTTGPRKGCEGWVVMERLAPRSR